MVSETLRSGTESVPVPRVVPPATETLLGSRAGKDVWPPDLLRNETFKSQVEDRKELIRSLSTVFDRIPHADMPVTEALERGFIKESDVVALYESCTRFLADESEYKRIILYMPFELIPARSWRAPSKSMQDVIERFNNAYMDRWYDLLRVRDVRANFVDGDVLETHLRTGDLPRVVKAAHLIPKLVEKGLLSNEEVFDIMAQASDETLRTSIADTIPVLIDMGLLSEHDRTAMSRSADPFLQQLATVFDEETQVVHSEPRQIDLSTLQADLVRIYADIQTRTVEGMTSSRNIWLQQEEKRRAVDKYAENIAYMIKQGTATPDELSHIALTANISTTAVIAHGIQKAIESSAQDDRTLAQRIYASHESLLVSLWQREEYELKDALEGIFSRLGALGIVSTEHAQRLGVITPELSGPASGHLARMRNEIREVSRMTRAIESHPALSHTIYSVSLVFGSRVKGYGARTADVDVAVFIKPGTTMDQLPQIRAGLAETFSYERLEGKIVEFWLEDKDGHFVVRDMPDTDSRFGEGSWTHVLFGAAWCGDDAVIADLHTKLLTPYFYDTHSTLYGRSARSVWLEEMERDILQYRLMHKGYARFFPEQGGIHTPHSDAIDGDSVFWDSGYRRMAMQLFANRVFLPSLGGKVL